MCLRKWKSLFVFKCYTRTIKAYYNEMIFFENFIPVEMRILTDFFENLGYRT